MAVALTRAQTPTGAIEGTITDPSGAVVPAAQVIVTEMATGRSITVTASASGLYSQRNLLPGMYRIRVEAAGFSAKEMVGVSVSAGAVLNGDVAVQVGELAETVEVKAETVAVDTARQTVDTVITAEDIRNNPTFSRNALDLAALAPGVVVLDGEYVDPTKAVAYRAVGVNGRSGTATRVQIDGVDVTDESVGSTTANISQEAVSEFQLTRSSLDISTSLTSSGAVNIISKSGGNQVHGSGFWDYYNQDMGARLDYNAQAEPFHRNRAGVTVSGPLKKDTLFWLANWERHYQTEQKILTVPEFPQLNTSIEFPMGIRYAGGRLDWNATRSLRVFFRFQHDWNLGTSGIAVSPSQTTNWTNVSTVGVNFNRGRSTHSYRFGYVNFNSMVSPQETGVEYPRVDGTPYSLNVGPYFAGPFGGPAPTYQDNYQNSYEGSLFTGRHTLRFGASVTRTILAAALAPNSLSVGGVYDAETIADIGQSGGDPQDPLQYPLEGFSIQPNYGYFMLAAAHNLPHGGHYNTRTAWFAGDSMKLGRHFTLNLGLRWEYDSGFFSNDPRVKRDPVLETWIAGASQTPKPPKDMFSPSAGFAWSPSASGKTVVRGGFYKAYEMNVSNNILFDESAMLPPGLGVASYGMTFVGTPLGEPIDIDGNHPEGDYSDLAGQPIGQVIGLLGQLRQAAIAAYDSYRFDPAKGDSLFRETRGAGPMRLVPGSQYKIPYALQFNLGIQRELRPGTVLSVDYIHNHAIGLPILWADYERRRDAQTLDVAAARRKINRVLGGLTVDDWMAENPGANIKSFGLATDAIWPGLTPDFTTAAFLTGGFARYRGLQASLRGRLRSATYMASYALGRSESSSVVNRIEFLAANLDNHRWNRKEIFGPNSFDHTQTLAAACSLAMPGGFRFNSRWTFLSAPPQTVFVPNSGGAISGAEGVFGTDLNGDGGVSAGTPRSDVLPGLDAGQLGRSVKSFADLNRIIEQFNASYAGRLTPHGQALVSAGLFTEAQLNALGAVTPAIAAVPLNNPEPRHNVFLTDVRLERPIKARSERVAIAPYVDVINLFNHDPAGPYGDGALALAGRFGALNFDYANAPPGLGASDLDAARQRISPNGTRKVQVGVRIDF